MTLPRYLLTARSLNPMPAYDPGESGTVPGVSASGTVFFISSELWAACRWRIASHTVHNCHAGSLPYKP
jgi:hypothetical protein